MLAATSLDRDYNPDPFVLALRILSSDRRLPDKLSAYVRDVIQQALLIAANPDAITSESLPEAIQLAVDLRSSADLRQAVSTLGNNPIPATTAREILAAEHRFAAPR